MLRNLSILQKLFLQKRIVILLRNNFFNLHFKVLTSSPSPQKKDLLKTFSLMSETFNSQQVDSFRYIQKYKQKV